MTESLPVHLPSLKLPDASDGAQSEAVIAVVVRDWSDWISHLNPQDLPLVQQATEALQGLGMAEQQAFWALDEGLKMPLEQHLSSGLTADSVHVLLKELQQYIRSIRPPKRKRPSLLERFKLLFSSHSSAWDLWLESFLVQQRQIEDLTARLERGMKTLKGESQVLVSHQQTINRHIAQLEPRFDLAVALSREVAELLTELTEESVDLSGLITQEFMPVIQKRAIELDQQLLMARQAYLTFDLLIAQNQNLVRDITVAMNNSRQILEVTAGLVVARRRNQHGRHQPTTQDKVQLADIRKAQLQEAQQHIERALDDIEQVKEDARQSHQQLLEQGRVRKRNQAPG